MRTGKRVAQGLTAFFAAITALSHQAMADDVVLMPFTCAVVDGRPTLTPAGDQGHRIFGAAERRKIKTCSTVETNYCRQWTAFKFDIDCGGVRVPWMQVYANAEEHSRRRVWQSNGQLRVQNTTRRSERIDDMCARRLGPQMEWGTTSEICDHASPRNSPNSTTMPAGFAPMLGLDAVIVAQEKLDGLYPMARSTTRQEPRAIAAVEIKEKTAQAKAAPAVVQPVAQHEAAAAPSEIETGASRVTSAPPVSMAEREAPAAVAKPDAPRAMPRDDAAPAQKSAEAATPPQAPAVAAASPSVEPAAPTPTPPEPTAPPAETLRVINGPATETADAISAAQPAEAQQPARSEVAQAEPAQIAADPVPTPPVVVAEDARDSTLTYAIAAFGAAALVMTVLVVGWLRRSGAPEPAPAANERRFEPAHRAPEAEPAFADTAPITVSRGELVTLATPVRPAMTRGGLGHLGDRMPATKGEALEVLGMGVASDGNLASLKKIIDGLRMNWHPDLAADDRDRSMRELRLKQINAAWEILEGKAA